MGELDRLLFLEVERAEQGQGRPVTETGESEDLPAQKSAPSPELFRAEILDGEIDQGRSAQDRDFADHLSPGTAGGPKREADIIAWKVTREEQIAFRIVAIEHLLLGQSLEIAGDRPFGPSGIAAHPEPDQLRHQHLEADVAVGDPLFGHFERGDVTRLAKDGRGAIAYLADHGDRLLLADEGGISRPKRVSRESAQIIELHRSEGDPDVAIFGPVERAGRPLDSAFDGQSRSRCLSPVGRGAFNLLAGWRQWLLRRSHLRKDRARRQRRRCKSSESQAAVKADSTAPLARFLSPVRSPNSKFSGHAFELPPGVLALPFLPDLDASPTACLA